MKAIKQLENQVRFYRGKMSSWRSKYKTERFIKWCLVALIALLLFAHKTGIGC